MSKLRLVVFDCDGTLVDSQSAIGQSMETAFKKVGLPYPGNERVKKMVGLSLHHACDLLLAEDQKHFAPALEEGYRETFADLRLNDRVDEPLYPEVLETLEALKGHGFLMGIATGKGHRGLLKTLGSHNILEFFDTLQTADHHPGKPNPSMLFKAMADVGAGAMNTLFVGDTTFDMEMGQNAGVRTLGVKWGYHEAGDLIAAGAQTILEGMDEVVHHALRL